MKAIVYEQYGPPEVLQFREVDKPIPKDNQVLLKIMAASLNSADWHLLRADPAMARLYSGLFKPKYTILGSDVSGIIESVGKNVRRFKPGDAVFGNLFEGGFGAFAEYACATESVLTLKPANISFEEAAATPLAATTALQGLRDLGRVQAGQRVLINGTSGGVGTFAVQMALWLGAEVTAVCSTRNQDMAKSLGADHVIDYTKVDCTATGQTYDLILAVNGYHSLADYRRALTPKGTYVMVGGTNAQMFQALLRGPWLSLGRSQKIKTLTLDDSLKESDLHQLRQLLEAGTIKPVIDRVFPLEQTAAAFRYLEDEHARGKIVIKVTGKD